MHIAPKCTCKINSHTFDEDLFNENGQDDDGDDVGSDDDK